VKSFRNIPGIGVMDATGVGVADIIGHQSLVISKAALEVLETRAAEVERAGGAQRAASGEESS
jgi:ribosomal protein L4